MKVAICSDLFSEETNILFMVIMYFWAPCQLANKTKRYLLPFFNTCHDLMSLFMQINTSGGGGGGG